MRELSQNQQLMLFTEDSLVDVSHSVWRVKKKDGVTTDIFGQSFRGWSKRLDQIGSLLKTYLESCQLPLMTYVRTWSTKATASGFGILKLRLSVPRIGEREYSSLHTPNSGGKIACLLPTPTVNDSKNNGAPSQRVRHSDALNVIAGGSLNPEWVEILMGFPRGWTEVGTP